MNAAIVIVGAGPAGMRAAEQVVAAGQRPVVIDEGLRCGGQIYRQPPAAFQRTHRALYGFEADKARALHERFAELLPQLDYRPNSLVWNIEHPALHLLQEGRADTLRYQALILATGATDRVLPFPGWTLPGVTTLGGAQVALKYQACLLGPRIVFAGTGPLLYLVAWQYASHGAQVVAVLDTAPPGAQQAALPQLLARPGVAARGAYFLARLRLAGVAVHHGVRLLRAQGVDRVTALHWRRADGHEQRSTCDAIATGHGLRSETQLADLAGCRFAYQPVDQAWLPERGPAGRSTVPGVYLAGDGAAILGADAAELSGAVAALAALEDLGLAAPASQAKAAALEGGLQRHTRFRAGLETAFALPLQWAAEASDELIVCRCEEITAGELRHCVKVTGTREMNRLKALTRIGMGRCQGRMCAPATARLLAHAAGCELQAVGRLRGQAPVKPVPIAALATTEPIRTVPPEQRDD